MSTRTLPHEIVALIHHVELTASGWRDRLAEQLLLVGLHGKREIDIASLTAELSTKLQQSISASAMTAAVQRLVSRGMVLRLEDGRISLSEAGTAEVVGRQLASLELSARVRQHFLALASNCCPNLDPVELWLQFESACLEPMVAELGARTHSFLSGRLEDGTIVHSMTGFVSRFDDESHAGLRRLLDEFFRVDNSDVRAFVLQHLNAHFLGLAASLPDHVLTSVAARLRKTVQFRLFLDTNFLFSVLDLHDNPANDAASELVALLKRVHGKLDFKLYVYPLTLDEVKRTLGAYESSLTETYLTPNLGRAALASRVGVSGIVLRYLRAAAEANGRISARDFLRPYLTNLISVLRAKGIEVYNTGVDGLTTTQPVIDDIVDVQAYEASRGAERPKSYEAIRHDVALWHLVHNRRGTNLSSPLDATYWVVTVDYRFLGFDGSKRVGKPEVVPVCVHPAVLLQMLQLLAPRDQALERAVFQGVRSLLPLIFDSQAEQTTMRILSTMSRFENVDDLPEDTVADLLLNDALRTSIANAPTVSAEIDLIKDAILGQVAVARAATAEAERQRSDVERRLAEHTGVSAIELATLRTTVVTATQERDANNVRLEAALSDREVLEAKVRDLEVKVAAVQAAEHDRSATKAQRQQWWIFGLEAALSFLLASAAGYFLSARVATSSSISSRVELGIRWSLTLGLGGALTWFLGTRLPVIRETKAFSRVVSGLRWVLGVFWTLLLGLLVNALWEQR